MQSGQIKASQIVIMNGGQGAFFAVELAEALKEKYRIVSKSMGMWSLTQVTRQDHLGSPSTKQDSRTPQKTTPNSSSRPSSSTDMQSSSSTPTHKYATSKS